MSAKWSEMLKLMVLWVSIGLPYVIAVNRIDDLVVQIMLTGFYLVAVLSVVRLVNRSGARLALRGRSGRDLG